MLVADLEALDAAVSRAIASGDAGELRVVGHGEISIVLGWPRHDPSVVCKRLPPFRDVGAFHAYRDVVLRYIEELDRKGVRVVETEVEHVVRPDGRTVGFHVQPLLPADALGTAVLRAARPADGHPIVPAVVDTVVRATTDRVGIDAQLSNWMWLDGEPWQLDLTTPFLLDRDHRLGFDLSPFLGALPAPLRPVVRREMTNLIRRWTTARGALVDFAANLLKEDLAPWVAPALETINARVEPPITLPEITRVHTQDRRLWPLLLRLEHLNRWWQRRVRRRSYEFLVPEQTTYDEPRAGAGG